MAKSNSIPIGYWKTKRGNDNYPVPVANSITDVKLHIDIVDKLLHCFTETGKEYDEYINRKRADCDHLENILLYGMEMRLEAYRGSSICRLCNSFNGSRELEIQKDNNVYVIPEGYLHYIIEHKVGIDNILVDLFNN